MTNRTVDDLLRVMVALRDRTTGCPWDVEQTLSTIIPYTIEEAYEVADAVDRGASDDLCDELGDLLLQVVFLSRIAEESGDFDFGDVTEAICDKMIRRHPHVFGDQKVADAQEQTLAWEALKAAERDTCEDPSALAGVSRGLPEWMRALKLQKRAASVGFDWSTADDVLPKIREELGELSEARPADRSEEFGDLMFAMLNYARKANLDFSLSLRQANAKFERRFRAMEQMAATDRECFADLDLEHMEQLWQRVKSDERES